MSKPEDQDLNNQEQVGDAPEVDGVEKTKAKAKIDSSESTVDGQKGDSAPDITEEVTVESLQRKLEQTLEEVTKFKDVALRAEAEMQNVRRRATKDLENAHKFGIEKFIQNILPVADGLEKAVESAESAANDDASKAISEGVGICQKMLLDVLQKGGVESIDPAGEPFDPNLHQAMSMVENAEVEPNSVVAVVQKGYTLNGRLVRPAMVMVSKPQPGDTPKIDETA